LRPIAEPVANSAAADAPYAFGTPFRQLSRKAR
jgi:hypothetical protein